MVAGHLREKNGTWQMILELKDSNGNRKTKSISTGLPVKGNKKKAEEMLLEARRKYENPKTINKTDADLYFHEYMEKWLATMKDSIAVSTYSGYAQNINSRIIPYFKEKKIRLCDLQAKDIQAFYTYVKQTYHISNKTINRYHANIRKALNQAFIEELIDVNPADRVEKSKEEKFINSIYRTDEVKELLLVAKVKNDPLELPIALAACYGLRREEIIGLKWNAIDFKNNTLTIQHTITRCVIDGKTINVARNAAKTKSSYRTFPLIEPVRSLLHDAYNTQKYIKKLCRDSYSKEYLDYVCVNKSGELMKPGYITQHFPRLLKNNDLKKIRFHDLRHSCASILHANGVPMKDIQDWLGHSSIKITMDLYTHLMDDSKHKWANTLESVMADK